MKILCIIPARSGSKGLPDKNIRNLFGKPLFAHSIEQAKRSKYVEHMKIVVSTDSEKYADIARHYGADVPFLRPIEISGDLSTDDQFILHALDNLEDQFDLVLQLRPTQPLRRVEDIDRCLDIMIRENTYTSLRSVVPFEKSPFKMYTVSNETLLPLYPDKCNLPRQSLVQCYLHNGYIDIVRVSVIKGTGSLTGDKIYPYIMDPMEMVDIDEEKDWPDRGYLVYDNVFTQE